MSRDSHAFAYVPPDGEPVFVGEWHPPGRRPPTVAVHITRDRAVAEAWVEELRVGRLPDRPQ